MAINAETLRRRLRERLEREARDAARRGLRRVDFSIYRQLETRTSVALLEGRVDGYPREEHRLDLGTTENPVESGSTLTDNAVKRRERLRLEGWVSDILPAPGRALRPDGATDVWGEIVELFENREIVTVYTALRTYRNMLVVRAVAPRNRDTGRSLRFTIDLAELLFSETSLARFPPSVVDPNGPAANRTSEVDGGDRAASILDLEEITIPPRLRLRRI